MKSWLPLTIVLFLSALASAQSALPQWKSLFNGLLTTPDNPRGNRSMSIENRSKPRGEWNVYDVVCVDGVIKLSVNGKFVNGVSKATQKKGYLCLESEGAEIHFRNIQVMELPSGVLTGQQVAPVIDDL